MIIESFLEDFGVEDDEIFSFESGHDAIEFIKENSADIVFTDINMPKMDGYEFAKLVFEIQPSVLSSFFAISGDESPESYMNMKKVGVQRFLKKPINNAHFRHFVLPEILKRRK
ncbi:response regulator receiver domain-containing protein [Sulfurimonas gotlandica GD1]|uniref:Response regulator receiver domain-containing protein n=2 Tax=Sulfurimonas TaxID=202746 RepID=B6BLA1_SULGG|nr:putative response regulator recevier domain protein [Sulfurimonas gotlandica GD1]EHP28554.1 response regulator receiver domain-containing protein [Sulfurimonas gotlandica GD1]